MVNTKLRRKWYEAGLAFECTQCARCCSGPGEGFIWVVCEEIELIADFLKMTPEQLRRKFLRRVGWRTSIIEHPATKDCIFLRKDGDQIGCAIYPVRPSQCRTWPFWPENISSSHAWNRTARTCPGINRGDRLTFEQIERVRKNRRWWEDSQ